MTEADLQRDVIVLARLLGYAVAYFRPGRVLRGGRETYETPIGADGKGWPDLVLASADRALFRELKSEAGRTTPEQDAWLDRLEAAGLDVGVWTPAAWRSGRIERELRGEA